MYSLSVIVAAGLLAQNPSSSPDILPLKKLRMYETGVGYYERDGKVSGKKKTSLPLPASHLDDALKTLVVLSNGRKVEIGGIEFSSAVSEGMARAIAGLPLEAETELNYYDLLASLEGVDVELKTAKQTVRGRLVEVLGPFQQKQPAPGANGKPAAAPEFPSEPEYTLVVRTQAGALRRIQTKDLSSIRPTEDSANARFEVALAALSSRAPQSEHALEVQIDGTGPLKLGYIAETPVWRTTYRVVLEDSEKAATLQAWALIHNDTDENWKKVDVELVNGRPTSFLFPLAAPRYARRDLAEPEVELSTIPQLLNTTPDRLWGDFIDGVGGLGLVGTGRGGGGTGSGTIGLGHTGTIGHGGGYGGEPALGDLAEYAQATGEESGALFVYRLPNPIDLAAHHSALVPVVQRRIEAEPITWFSDADDEALMAARLVNSTDQTLPAGTVAFFDQSGFQGESGFDRLKPGEQTFAVHGVDLDVDLTRDKKHVGEDLHDVSFPGGRLRESLVVESKLTIELRNRSGRVRSVYVGLPVSRNAKLTGHDALDYDHIRSMALAKYSVPAGKTSHNTLKVKEADHRTTDIEHLSSAALFDMADSKTLSVPKREILRSAGDLMKKLEANQARRGERLTRISQLESELVRLREDLRAFGSAGLQNRSSRNISQRVVEREDELEKLRDANEKSKRRDPTLLERINEELSEL